MFREPMEESARLRPLLGVASVVTEASDDALRCRPTPNVLSGCWEASSMRFRVRVRAKV